MLPMVVAGGLSIALSFAFGITAFKEPGTLAAALMQIGGGSAFAPDGTGTGGFYRVLYRGPSGPDAGPDWRDDRHQHQRGLPWRHHRGLYCGGMQPNSLAAK